MRIAPIDYSGLPARVAADIRAYVETGREPGGSVRALLENDFAAVMGSPIARDFETLRTVAVFLAQQMPCICWGDVGRVEAWIERGGLRDTVLARAA